MIGQLDRSLDELLPQAKDQHGAALLYSLDDIVRGLAGGDVAPADVMRLLDDYQARGLVGTVQGRRDGSADGAQTDGSASVLYYRKARLPETPRARRSYRKPSSPSVAGVVALRTTLGEAHDRLRKLKLLLKSRTDHGDLAAMTQKWRGAAQDVLTAVTQRLTESRGGQPIRTRQVLQSLGVDWQTVDLDLSDDEADAEHDDRAPADETSDPETEEEEEEDSMGYPVHKRQRTTKQAL